MNRPDRASEPSMDEILASIRRIIAEEPAQPEQSGRSSEPVVSPLPSNPLLRPAQPVPGQAPAPPRLRETLPLPSFDRITDALRNPAAANTKPIATRSNGSRGYVATVPRDDDLADMLQEPLEAGDDEPGASVSEGSDYASTAPAGSTAAEAAAAVEHDPPKIDEAWAVWRQTIAPPAGANPPFGTLGNRRSPVARGVPAVPPISGVTADEFKANGSDLSRAVPAGETSAPAAGPVVIAAMPPAIPAAAGVKSDAGRMAEERKAQEQVSVLLPPRQIAMESVPSQSAPDSREFENDAAAMAASALELLAGGSPSAERPSPTFTASIAAARAAIAAHNNHDAASTPSTSLAVASESGQPVRSLEDAVAEMLRPMLQQWLTDHMPRIIEKALRIETVPSVKDGSQ